MAAGSLNPLVKSTNDAAAQKGMVGRGGGDQGAVNSAKASNANTKTKSQKAKTKQKEETPSSATKKSSMDTYVYPADLPIYTMQLLFGPYNRQVAFNDALVDHDLSITLPLPPNLGESFGLKYNTNSFGPLMNEVMAGAANVATKMGTGKGFAASVSKEITDRINKAARGANEVVGAGMSLSLIHI